MCPSPIREYRDYLTRIHHYLTELAWLYHMNSGVFMTPGADEEWTLSVLHTDADLRRYVEVFELFARDVTGSRVAAARPADGLAGQQPQLRQRAGEGVCARVGEELDQPRRSRRRARRGAP